MKAMVFKKVNKIFPTGQVGLEDIDFTIQEGEFVFVIGRSGAGKSTLLKMMSHQIEPSSGEIEILGNRLSELEEWEKPYLRRKIGIMQPEFGLLDDRTLSENVRLAMEALEVPGRVAKKRVEQMLKTMGIHHRAKFYPKEVSVGEAARALLARAMVVNPSILIADEPTANLDPDTSWDLMCLLEDFNKMGVTVIVASHNEELVNIMRKRVMTLNAGCLVADEKHARYNTFDSDIYTERRILDERARKQTK